ncbi:hypothetical protein FV222_06780 [Methylobacterium sp. WL103]|uniref:hypothetical protein n=1 Tax=Methylobacterium sp. WL103 TaxID=2603891 RepID=UPI0011CC0B27|nr:hypothetical protein [Methylobacterium sp. WL103]TXN05315.1 hypothetical protein FV222_06780 [Methylobacterium sp. WL103]
MKCFNIAQLIDAAIEHLRECAGLPVDVANFVNALLGTASDNATALSDELDRAEMADKLSAA